MPAARRSPRSKTTPERTIAAASPKSSPKLSPGSRSSPRLAARNDAAKTAARLLAGAIRERVWAEVKAEDGQSYYYSLSNTTQTSWTLPSWAILRAAGRDSLCPPRPSVGASSRPSVGASSRKSSARNSRASARDSQVSSISRTTSFQLGELVEAAEAEVEAAEAKDAVASPASTDAYEEEEELEEQGAPEDTPPKNMQLQELLHLQLGWLAETKAMYQQARSEMLTLRVDQMGGMRQAQVALEKLAKVKTAEAPPAAEESGDLSVWSAECDRLRDGLSVSEAKLAASLDAKVTALAEADALRIDLEESRRENATLTEQLQAGLGAAQGMNLAVQTAEQAAAEQAAQEAAAELVEARAEAEAAEGRLATAQTAMEALRVSHEDKLEAMRLSHGDELASMRQAIDTAESATGRMRGELALETGAHQSTIETLEACEAAKSKAEVEVSSLKGTLRALHACHEKTVAELDELKGTVRVLCRMRPLAPHEGENPTTRPVANALMDGSVTRNIMVSPANATSRNFEFDRAFGPDAPSEDIFEELRPLTRKVASGAAATILAYGQTGSGKTYTVNALHSMVVEELLASYATLPYAEVSPASNESRPPLAVCMAEVYLDQVRDLAPHTADAAKPTLASGSTVAPAKSGGDGPFGEISLTWHYAHDADEAAARVAEATERRKTADNGLNSCSSRSHLVVVYALCTPQGERRGQLALVDLAGSERLTRTEATGERLQESVSINKSLSSLGDVLHALIGKNEHVPYRNSKLTTLLQPCLRRGCRVAMILAASPSDADAAETMQTLAFGVRARACALGPAATVSGGLAVGGKGGAAAVKGGEIGRLSKQLEESRKAAAANEKAASDAKKQAVAAEEALKASSAATKRAEAKAKEAEVALEKRTASAQSDKTRAQKELADLQRKLDVATRFRRAGANQADAVSAPTAHAAPPAPPAVQGKSTCPGKVAPHAPAPAPVPAAVAPAPPVLPSPAPEKEPEPEKEMDVPIAPVDGAPRGVDTRPADAPSSGRAAWPGEMLRRLSNVMDNVASAASSGVLSPLRPSQSNSSARDSSISSRHSPPAKRSSLASTDSTKPIEAWADEAETAEAAAATPAAAPRHADRVAHSPDADSVAADEDAAAEAEAAAAVAAEADLAAFEALADKNDDFSCRLSGVSDEGGSWLQPRLSLVRQNCLKPNAFEISLTSEIAAAEMRPPAAGSSSKTTDDAAVNDDVPERFSSFETMCRDMKTLAKSPMPRLPTELIMPCADDETAATPTAVKKAAFTRVVAPNTARPLLSKPVRVPKTPSAANKSAPLTCPARVARSKTMAPTNTNGCAVAKWQTSARTLALSTPRVAKAAPAQPTKAMGKGAEIVQPRWN